MSMIDIAAPKLEVEVLIRDDKLWVNVDGICHLRIYYIPPGILKIDCDNPHLILEQETQP